MNSSNIKLFKGCVIARDGGYEIMGSPNGIGDDWAVVEPFQIHVPALIGVGSYSPEFNDYQHYAISMILGKTMGSRFQERTSLERKGWCLSYYDNTLNYNSIVHTCLFGDVEFTAQEDGANLLIVGRLNTGKRYYCFDQESLSESEDFDVDHYDFTINATKDGPIYRMNEEVILYARN